MTQETLIKTLNLEPHPEGGFFKETYRSEGSIPAEALPATFGSRRHYATGIYFLLTSEAFSAFHKVRQDEMWHFYLGQPITLHQLNPNGSYQKVTIGQELENGHVLQYTVPGGCWFAAEVKTEGFALVGCTVSPGFDFADFTLAKGHELVDDFPEQKALISRLTQQ